MNWNKVEIKKDLPDIGMLVIVCRDLGDKKQYYIDRWNTESVRYWELNNVIAWSEVEKFEN